MAAYRKFSAARWPISENQNQRCPPPKVPKPPKAATELEPTLGGLGGAPVHFRKSEAAEGNPRTLGALGGLGGAPADFRKSEVEGHPATLGALGGLGGVPADSRKSEQADVGRRNLADWEASTGVPPGDPDSAYIAILEQTTNHLFSDQPTQQTDPAGKVGHPPGAENQDCGSHPPKVPKPPKVGADGDDLAERAAIIEEAADVPRRWAEDYAALCTMAPPSGFSPERWRQVVDAAGIFLDRWAGDAIRCDWCDLHVFGCHDTAPDHRRDSMGLVLLLDRCKVSAIDRDGADLMTASGAHQRFYRRPLPPGTVALGELTSPGRSPPRHLGCGGDDPPGRVPNRPSGQPVRY
jgi:hypothetical protein